VIIDNAEKALDAACRKTGALISEYTAAPVYMDDNIKACHEWLIEFEIPPSDLRVFSLELDLALKNLNSDYEAKRYKDITLGPPKVQNIRKGTFYKWFQEKGKLGGQNKMPRLSNERKYVEEILKLVGTEM
jgi:hypothetical protein